MVELQRALVIVRAAVLQRALQRVARVADALEGPEEVDTLAVPAQSGSQ